MKTSSNNKIDIRAQIGRITSLLDSDERSDELSEDTDYAGESAAADNRAGESAAADNHAGGSERDADGEDAGRVTFLEADDRGFFEKLTPHEGGHPYSERADEPRAPLEESPILPQESGQANRTEDGASEDGEGFAETEGEGFAETEGEGFAETEEADDFVGPIDAHGNIIEIDDEPALVNGKKIRDRVVRRLVAKGIVTDQQLAESIDELARLRNEGYKVPLWRVITLDPRVDREKIYREAADVYAFKEAQIGYSEALAFIEAVADQFEGPHLDRMIELFVIPISHRLDSRTGEVLWVFATHDPTRPEVHKLIQRLRLNRFELHYTSESFIRELITEGFLSKNEYLDRLNDDPLIYDLGTNYEDKNQLIDEEALEAEINRSSLINLFEATLVEAVKKGASDIHVYPNSDGNLEIDFRIDGELERWHLEERIHPEAFLAVVKDNSMNVDRFERDTAQDGAIQRRIADALIRFRVSILPIASHRPGINAESIVVRVLDDRKVLTDLGKLGMLDDSMSRFETAIRQPHGMIILTGPTGSGKSTTLVAALHQVITPKVNVLTVEDPVEYLIRGVRQIKLSHRLDMEGALRSILRHDPDIVMVGEMRDRQTAELAIKLANTGHLTFSTLHTNDAPSAVSRLYKMGIEPFLIAYAINIVVAQRLIRKLCSQCKKEEKSVDADLLKYLGFTDQEIKDTKFFGPTHGAECRTCGGQGYKGRRAIAETLLFSNSIRKKILAAGEVIDEDTLREQATSEGMRTLRDSAKMAVMMGDTSVEELVRVTGAAE